MKRTNFFLLVVVIVASQACNNGSTDTVSAAKDSNDNKDSSSMVMHTDSATSAAPVDKGDADFAVEAANGAMMEVALGNYAQQNAVSKRVKDFGAIMVRDHSMANEELKNIAAAKNITLPAAVGDDAHKDMEDIMKKKGSDFDKAYMDMMLDDHKKDVKEFEKAAKECKDPELRNFAGKTLPVLQGHLDSTKAITGKK